MGTNLHLNLKTVHQLRKITPLKVMKKYAVITAIQRKGNLISSNSEHYPT